MKKSLLKCLSVFSLLCVLQQVGFAQVVFTSWVHTPYISLYAAAPSAGVSTATGIVVDDAYSGIIPIGFNFNFFGNSYSNLVIGANGDMSFDTTLAGGYDPWPINDSIQGNSELYNCIAGLFCDMDVVYGGDITYFVTGTAPNRIFGANYCHNGMFDSVTCPGQYTTTQMLIYESTNVIESHITHKTICSAWNGGYAIVGVENSTGTSAYAAPGRNYPDTFDVTNEAWRFTPDASDTVYTPSSITFAPIPYYTIYWYDSASGAYLGSGDSIVLEPSAPTTYIAYAVGCMDSASTGFDTVARGHMTLLPLGTSILPLTTNLQLYPNPAHHEFSIVYGATIERVVITNIIGQEMFAITCNDKALTVNTTNFPKGLYFVKINDAIVEKLVIE